MKKLHLLFIFSWISIQLSAQTTFRVSYDVASFDISGGMVQNPAGDFVMAGTNTTLFPLYGNVMKLNASGSVIWANSYVGGLATDFWDIKNVSTGGYIMAGSSSGNGAILVRIDDNGALIWAQRYQLPNRPSDDPSSEFASSVIETSDGGFLVGGSVDFFWDGVSGNTVDTTSAMGFKVNSTGTLQWCRVWTIATTNPDEHYINDVGESTDGYFFVGESSEGAGTPNSDGDYPRNALLIKTNTSGTLTYARRWGTGNGNSEGLNSIISIPGNEMLIGGYDNSDATLFKINGTGGTPTLATTFNIKLQGGFLSTYLIQDIMRNSDGNFSCIGMNLAALNFNTTIFKFNSTTETQMIGRSYAPIGFSAILPEGGLASDQGYFMTMTEQQTTGFNYNIIRTDAAGNLNDVDPGCSPSSPTPVITSYDPVFSVLTPSVFTLGSGSAFTPVVSSITPTKGENCLNVVCTAPAAPTASASPATICNGSSSTITSTAPAGVTFYYYTVATGGTAFASGGSTVVSPTTTTTYYVESDDNSNPGCKSARTAVTVTVNQPPVAGTNGVASFCSNSASGNLFASLGGTPDATGTWSGPSALTGGNLGTYNPASAVPGVYTYTVTGTAPCANATATVNVTENTAPNAGTAGTITLCSSSSSVNLFASLGGSPAATGTWSGPSVLTGGNLGTYNPASAAPGVYTYTVTGTAPCANATATVTVTENTAPVAGTNGVASFCSNSASGNLFASLGGTPDATGTWSGPSALTGGNLGTYNPASAVPGLYTYTVTGTSPCANATATVNVTETTAPNAGTNGSITLCSTGSTANLFSSLGGSPSAGGTWLGPTVLTGGSLGTFNSGSNSAGLYDYTVLGTGGCANATASVTVTLTSVPNPGNNNTITLCSNGAPVNLLTQLLNSPDGGGVWTGPSALTGGANGTFTPGTNTAGVYTYTLTGAGACSGTFTSTLTVNIVTAPNSGTNGTLTLCSNGSSSNLFAALGGSPSTNGTWTGPSGLTGGSLGTFTPGTNVAGLYTYTVLGSAPCAANSTSTVNVTINTAPNAGTNGTLSICSNDAATNLFSLLGSSPTAGGTWTGPSALTGGSVGTFMPGTNTAGTYTYTVAGTSPCANGTATVVVTINTVPTAVTANATSTSICFGQSTTITATGFGATSYNVYDAPSSGNLLGTVPLSVSPTSTTTFYIEALSAAGCNQTGALATVTITVIPIDNPAWTSPGATCVQAGAINLDALITGTSGGTWSGTGVTGNSFDPTGLAGQTISITYTVGGSPCQQTSTQTISVQSTISGAWTTPGTICESDGIVNLNSLITGTAGGSWSGTGVTGNSFDPTGLSGTVSITYSVGVNPCIDIVSHDIIVNSSPLDPTVLVSNSTVCAGESVTITASGSGGGVTYNIYDAATGGNLLGTSPMTFVPTSTDSYFIEVTNANGCINLGGREEVIIVVNPLPIADAGANVQLCPNDGVNLIATGGGTYLWSTAETSATINVSPAINTTYYVTVTNTFGCTASDSVMVTIYTGAGSLLANLDSTVTEESELIVTDVALNDAGNINTVSILTNPSNGSVTVSGTNVSYLPNDGFIGTDTLTYIVCDAFCTSYCDTALLIIRVTEDVQVFVPNGFSPNGDGINDVLEILGLDDYPENELFIYNRWGELVYYSKPYNNDWSGQSNNDKLKLTGDEVIDGTYFYVLKLAPDVEGMNGYIELRRR